MILNRRPLPFLKLFYTMRPFIPRRLQIFIRRRLAEKIKNQSQFHWPISPQTAPPPSYWKGWKNDKQFALILTHDVDTQKGYDDCHKLLELEKEMGFLSSFYFVPERYNINKDKLLNIQQQGFEVGVHGFNHDGKLLQSKKIFMQRAKKINEYIKNWEASGFRAPSMHHNLELFKHLNIQYDSSTFDTDPFEPQSDGVNTIFPFYILNNSGKISYWELPYTLPQDNTLFILLQKQSIDIWKKKLDWIAENRGMALLNTHPDYINFNGNELGFEEYPVAFYKEFLSWIKEKYSDRFWNPLAREMVTFLNKRYS